VVRSLGHLCSAQITSCIFGKLMLTFEAVLAFKTLGTWGHLWVDLATCFDLHLLLSSDAVSC